MKTNFTAYQGNRTVMAAVNAGEIPAGVIYHYYWFGDQANTGENSQNVVLHYFKNEDPGAFVSVSGGGVLAVEQEPGGGTGVPRVHHRCRRADDPPDRRLVRVRDRERRGRESGPRAARRRCRRRSSIPRRSTARVTTDLMTQAGIL